VSGVVKVRHVIVSWSWRCCSSVHPKKEKYKTRNKQKASFLAGFKSLRPSTRQRVHDSKRSESGASKLESKCDSWGDYDCVRPVDWLRPKSIAHKTEMQQWKELYWMHLYNAHRCPRKCTKIINNIELKISKKWTFYIKYEYVLLELFVKYFFLIYWFLILSSTF